MRWKSQFGGMVLLLLLTLVGCKAPVLTPLADYDHYAKLTGLPDLSHDPNVGTMPVIKPCPTPTTVLDPERPPRNICLAECIAMSLEGGVIGNTNLLNQSLSIFTQAQPGATAIQNPVLQDTTLIFTGQGTSGADAIRVIRLDPATTGTNIELALSRFDAIWNTSMTWTNTDQPIGTSLQTFQAGNSGVSALVQEQATLSSTLVKPLPTGGLAGITLNLPYTYTDLPARVNPAYQPQLQLSFEQPLLRGYGVEIQQIAQSHPGSILGLIPFFQGSGNPVAPSPESILVSRIRFDQSRADFERQLNLMVANVEIAYWNLYYAYWALYANEQALRQGYETWKLSLAKFNAGSLALGDLAQARGQYEQFRAFRLSAMNDVMELERQLRGMIGLPPEDGHRLIPSDSPTLAPFRPSWDISLQEALVHVPDLAIAREDVKANQMNVLALKNQLLPDLRVTAQYDTNSIGTRLDGATADNALRNLATNNFNDWSIGLRMIVPIGFRQAHANLRAAQLRLARSLEVLRNIEQRVERSLTLQYRRMATEYELIKIQRSQREAFADQLRARFLSFLQGRADTPLNLLLQAQQQWAAALQSEYLAIRDYNISIVGFEAVKGTNLGRNSVIINEGLLPVKAQKRAAEHERQRDSAIPLRERALPVDAVPLQSAQPPVLEVNNNTPDQVQSLTALWQRDPPLKDAPELPPMPAFPGAAGIQQVGGVELPGGSSVTPTVLTSTAARVGPPVPPSASAAQAFAPGAPTAPQSPAVIFPGGSMGSAVPLLPAPPSMNSSSPYPRQP